MEINSTTMKSTILMLVFILIVVCLPLIILGKFILEKENKYKKIKILIMSIIMICIYIFNWNTMINYARKIIINISKKEIVYLKETEKEKIDISYLYNYTQTLSKKGYLSQYDVKQIISIADSKSSVIWINYKDEKENIEVNTVNKNDYEIKELEENLKSDYYQFNYYINENNEVVININRYIVEQNKQSEKNENIVLTGSRNSSIIKNVHKYVADNHESFLFENELNFESESEDKTVKSFKILLDYDKQENNYVPVIGELKEYELIHSYKVYQSGVEIILKEDVVLDNKDYTIRLNRYDNELHLKNNSSFYEYEPIVTQMTTYKNKIVLEMKFNQDYTIDEIQNIEIIFGK